jgi:hypothetical protein
MEIVMHRTVSQNDIQAALSRLGWPEARPEMWTSDRRLASLVRSRAGVQMVHVCLADGVSGWVLVRGGLDG